MTLKELKKLAEAATRGRLHIGHISQEDDYCDVDNEELINVAERMRTKDALFFCKASPDNILTLLSALEKYEEALVGLRYGCGEPKCFCDVSIGNPMYRGHSDSCKRATDTLTQVQKIMEGK